MSNHTAGESVNVTVLDGKVAKHNRRTETARHRRIAARGRRKFAHLNESRLKEAKDYWEVMDAIETLYPLYLHSPYVNDQKMGVKLHKFRFKRRHQ